MAGLDEHDRDVTFERAEEAHHALRLVEAHAGDRLVEQEQAWLRRERHRDLELPLLAVGEVRREHVRAPAEPH